MSSFIQNTKHPKTGEWEDALWLDDYYGHHHYGVMWLGGTMTDPEKVDLLTSDTLVQHTFEDFVPNKATDSNKSSEVRTKDTPDGTQATPGPISIDKDTLAELFYKHIPQAESTITAKWHRYDKVIEIIDDLLPLIESTSRQRVKEELESLPFTDRETGCMDCIAASLVADRIKELS